ncbi:MAG: hypothetical protein HRU78_13290 [Gammaproteobacteria bacterium]|jgi:hypothetical protein|nr:hypothetical protein [Pseudomonadota bacterium]QOJ24497.1 MAG: hypothetical protein HRU78_13290 [Gammaproteobacteria bacterium]
MKILVHFKSGFKQIFIVPKSMLALEFRNMAKEIGGNIDSIEFSLPPRRQSGITTAEQRLGIVQLPDKR